MRFPAQPVRKNYPCRADELENRIFNMDFTKLSIDNYWKLCYNVIRKKKEDKSMEKWFKNHNFPYIKTKDGSYFWQTNVATGEMTPSGEIVWHEKSFFEKVKKTIDK